MSLDAPYAVTDLPPANGHAAQDRFRHQGVAVPLKTKSWG